MKPIRSLPPAPAVRRITGAHDKFIGALCIHGQTLISASEDGRIRRWALPEGRPLDDLGPKGAPVNTLALSPDGRLLVSGSDDRRATVWDLQSGRPLHRLELHQHYIRDVQISADGQKALTSSQDGTIGCWRLSDGEMLCHLRHPEDTTTVNAAAFTAGGTRAVSIHLSNRVLLWDLERGELIAPLFEQADSFVYDLGPQVYFAMPNTRGVGHVNPPNRLCVHGATVLSASDDVIVWDLERREQLRCIRAGTWPIEDMKLLDDGRSLLVAGISVALWDLPTGRRRWALPKPKSKPMSVAWGNGVLAVGTKDGTLELWELDQLEDYAAHTGHTNSIGELWFTGDGRSVISSASDGSAICWDAETNGITAMCSDCEDPFVVAQTEMPDGRIVLTAGGSPPLLLWNPETGESESFRREEMHYGAMQAREVSGGLVVTGIHEDVLWWEPPAPPQVFEGKANHVTGLVVTPDGRYAVTRSFTEGSILQRDVERTPGPLRIWDIRKKRLVHVLQAEENYAHLLVLDEQTAVAALTATLQIVDLPSGTVRQSWSVEEYSEPFVLADGSLVTLFRKQNESAQMQVWDPRTGECLETRPAPVLQPLGMVQSGGRCLFYGQEQAVLLEEDGTEQGYTHSCRINQGALRPDGLVAIGDEQGRVVLLRSAAPDGRDT